MVMMMVMISPADCVVVDYLPHLAFRVPRYGGGGRGRGRTKGKEVIEDEQVEREDVIENEEGEEEEEKEEKKEGKGRHMKKMQYINPSFVLSPSRQSILNFRNDG